MHSSVSRLNAFSRLCSHTKVDLDTSRGVLVPLESSLDGQIRSIAAEYGLPPAKTQDMEIYLLSTSDTLKSQVPSAGGPRISPYAWNLLWRDLYADQDPVTSIRTSVPSEDSFSPYPPTTPSAASSGRQLGDASSPFDPFSPQHRVADLVSQGPRRESSSSFNPSPPFTNSTNAYGSALVVGRVEFDILPEQQEDVEEPLKSMNDATHDEERTSMVEAEVIPTIPRRQSSWAKPRKPRLALERVESVGETSAATAGSSYGESRPTTPSGRHGSLHVTADGLSRTSSSSTRPGLQSRWRSRSEETVESITGSNSTSAGSCSHSLPDELPFSGRGEQGDPIASTSKSDASDSARKPSMNLASYLGNYLTVANAGDVEATSAQGTSASEQDHHQSQRPLSPAHGVGLGVFGVSSTPIESRDQASKQPQSTPAQPPRHDHKSSLDALNEALGLDSPTPNSPSPQSTPVLSDRTNTFGRFETTSTLPEPSTSGISEETPLKSKEHWRTSSRPHNEALESPDLSVITEASESLGTPRAPSATPMHASADPSASTNDSQTKAARPESIWSTTVMSVPQPSRRAPAPPSVQVTMPSIEDVTPQQSTAPSQKNRSLSSWRSSLPDPASTSGTATGIPSGSNSGSKHKLSDLFHRRSSSYTEGGHPAIDGERISHHAGTRH